MSAFANGSFQFVLQAVWQGTAKGAVGVPVRTEFICKAVVKAVSDGNFDDLCRKIKGLTYGCIPDIEAKRALAVTFCFGEVSADPDGRDCAFNAKESVRHA